MAKGKYEGSRLDEKRDAKAAKKAGVSRAAWEKTPMDRKMDKAGQKAMDKKRK